MTEDDALFNSSVPVLRKYLTQIMALVENAGTVALETRLTEDAFPAGVHFRIAQGYALRIVCPLVGRDVPELPEDGHDAVALRRNDAMVQAELIRLTPADFQGACLRVIDHRAGFADLSQSAKDFLLFYGMPNFFFHLVNGYATLRKSGAKIGKSDFDGLHSYPADFSFETKD